MSMKLQKTWGKSLIISLLCGDKETPSLLIGQTDSWADLGV